MQRKLEGGEGEGEDAEDAGRKVVQNDELTIEGSQRLKYSFHLIF